MNCLTCIVVVLANLVLNLFIHGLIGPRKPWWSVQSLRDVELDSCDEWLKGGIVGREFRQPGIANVSWVT